MKYYFIPRMITDVLCWFIYDPALRRTMEELSSKYDFSDPVFQSVYETTLEEGKTKMLNMDI